MANEKADVITVLSKVLKELQRLPMTERLEVMRLACDATGYAIDHAAAERVRAK